jgi:sulfur-oxidizing protein SoxY
MFIRSVFYGVAITVWGILAGSSGALAAEQGDLTRWNDIRPTIFGDSPIGDGDGVLALDTPMRAEDAAIVPISILALKPQTKDSYISKLTLIIDENPAPLVAVFHLSPANGSGTISTRVRVNDYTNIRAVAQMSDGKLVMVSRYVKAAGGCSAPAGKDQQAALARLGKMKFVPPEQITSGQPSVFHLLISHPNNSGLQFDQMTRNYVPAHYVKSIEITFDGAKVLTVEPNISISEDPSLHFSWIPDHSGTFQVKAVDSRDQVYTGSFPIKVSSGS